MLGLSLYHGVSEAVDDTAHLSGLAYGFLLAFVLLKLFPPKERLREAYYGYPYGGDGLS